MQGACRRGLASLQLSRAVTTNETTDPVSGAIESECRAAGLALCGAHYRSREAVNSWVQQLLAEGLPERAAMVALFHDGIAAAVDCLQKYHRGSPAGTRASELAVVAMALAGSSSDGTLWHSTCSDLANSLSHPCLRVMFHFLIDRKGDGGHTQVLREEEVLLEDRVAFACRFLPFEQLTQELNDLSAELTSAGNLRGLALTGIVIELKVEQTPGSAGEHGQGLTLLQKYVDRTCDIQTAALLCVRAGIVVSDVQQPVTQWMEVYRDMMDRWKLWHQR